jgi:MOB kinase activator 1
MLPQGEDQNEWLAVNTVDFFNTTNLLYGSITEFCTNSECPTMSAGPEFEYFWMDGVTIKKPIKCTAPEYVDFLMTWVEKLINDEKVFPASPSMLILFFTDIKVHHSRAISSLK